MRPDYGATSTTPIDMINGAPPEFTALCDRVVTNFYTINSNLKTLDNALKTIGSRRDSAELRNTIHVTQINTNSIAALTTRDIQNLKYLATQLARGQQLQVEKLEDNFLEVIESYGSLQAKLVAKQKSHMLVKATIENDSSDELEQTQLLSRQMQSEEDSLVDVDNKIRQIEADILDVGEIMKQLGTMVHSQGESIDTIENSIDHTAGNVEEARDQLSSAERYKYKYRKCMLLSVLLVIVVLSIIISIVVYDSKKK